MEPCLQTKNSSAKNDFSSPNSPFYSFSSSFQAPLWDSAGYLFKFLLEYSISEHNSPRIGQWKYSSSQIPFVLSLSTWCFSYPRMHSAKESWFQCWFFLTVYIFFISKRPLYIWFCIVNIPRIRGKAKKEWGGWILLGQRDSSFHLVSLQIYLTSVLPSLRVSTANLLPCAFCLTFVSVDGTFSGLAGIVWKRIISCSHIT